MTIGQLARETDVPASTIRYWESAGVLPKPARAGGKRQYSPDTVHRVALLKLAQLCGFSLDEIRRLLHGFDAPATPSQRWRQLAARKQGQIDEQLVRLQTMKRVVGQVLDCQCPNLTECGRIAAAQAPGVRPRGSRRGFRPLA